MKVASIIIALWACCSLSMGWAAEESTSFDEPMVVNSGDAEYDGETITLSGEVVIQHGLGTINARHLKISPTEEQGKKLKFSLFKVENDVVIQLKGGGKLNCQQAQINYGNLKGIFLGNEKEIDVVYTDFKRTKGPNTKQIPLIIKSQEIQTNLKRVQNSEDGTKHTLVSQVQALGNVRVHYNQDYLILSDYATYDRLPQQQDNRIGILTLEVSNPSQNFCFITNQNEDHIKARRIILDTAKRHLMCHQPIGTLKFALGNHPQQTLCFNSEKLLWDDKEQVLTLYNQIKAFWGDIGELSTDKELRIYQHVVNKKKTIRSVVSPEDTLLVYTDPSQIVHKMMCHGALTIDHEHFQIILDSPRDGFGVVLNDKQVAFEDILGDIYADRIILNYGKTEGSLVPSNIMMYGHVKILNRFDGHVQESGSVLQYALADKVEYDPQTKVMVLSGQHGQRVLFYDKVNNIQMSAPALKVKRDEKTPKGAIQGVGDVRFTFIEHEFNQLRERFQFKEQLN